METGNPRSPTSARGEASARVPILLLSLGFLVFYYLIFFPGILREDSSDQLGQALRHEINDWHSPVMTLLWSWINHVYVGPAGMLLLSQGSLFLGLGIILHLAFSDWRQQLNVLLLLTLFPINFCLIGGVTKTGLFTALMILGIALAGLAACSGTTRAHNYAWNAFATGVLALAIAIRPDGVAATLPVFGWLGWTLTRPSLARTTPGRLGLVLIGLVLISLACTAGVVKLNALICRERRTHPEQIFMAGDLIALSLEQDRLLIPSALLTPGADLSLLRRVSHPCGVGALYWTERPVLRLVAHEDEFRLLASAWRKEIAHHPFLYLKERVVAFYYFLGPEGGPYAAPTFSVWNNTWGYFPSFAAVHADFHPGPLSSIELMAYYYSRDWFFEKPYFFAFLALLNAIYLGQRREPLSPGNQLSLVLSLSGLAHLALLFFFTPDCDYRYSGWLIFSSSLACLLTAMRWLPGKKIF